MKGRRVGAGAFVDPGAIVRAGATVCPGETVTDVLGRGATLPAVGCGALGSAGNPAPSCAAIKAADEGLEVSGSVMASDAFFPFRDGIDAAAEHGISAIIQPGGSMRDNEVIEAANEHGLAMVFTGMRHFRH